MKIKLGTNYYFEKEDESYPFAFLRGEVHEVVHQFEHERWGMDNHTVYVIINKGGESMSISAEACKEVK